MFGLQKEKKKEKNIRDDRLSDRITHGVITIPGQSKVKVEEFYSKEEVMEDS